MSTTEPFLIAMLVVLFGALLMAIGSTMLTVPRVAPMLRRASSVSALQRAA
jgi:hypothetical protein